MLLGGTADETWRPGALAVSPSIEVLELPRLDHSLQVPGDPAGSLQALAETVSVMDRFLAAVLA